MKILELALSISECAINPRYGKTHCIPTYVHVVNNFLMSLSIGIFDRLNSDNQAEIFSILCVQKIRFLTIKYVLMLK